MLRGAFYYISLYFAPFARGGVFRNVKVEKDRKKSYERLDKINTVCYNKIRENTWASRGLAYALFSIEKKDGYAA